jgi:hypothetical protein
LKPNAARAQLAKDMFAWSLAAQSKLQSRIKQYGIQCDMVHAGHVTLSITGDTLHECEEEVALINSELDANWEVRCQCKTKPQGWEGKGGQLSRLALFYICPCETDRRSPFLNMQYA